MRNVFLYGALGREFGRRYAFDADTVPEIIQALRANFPRFANALRHGFYRIVVGKNVKTGFDLDEAEIPGLRLGKQDVHIVPVTEGAKRGGLMKVIAGIALIGLSLATGGAGGALAGPLFGGTSMSGATLAGNLGTALAMNGIATLIAPEHSVEDTEKSFTMSGPSNTTREGAIVPIAYGEVISGGVLISGGVTIMNDDNDGAPVVAFESVPTTVGNRVQLIPGERSELDPEAEQ